MGFSFLDKSLENVPYRISSQLRFLWESSNDLLFKSPKLSQILMINFLNVCLNNNLELDNTIKNLVCVKCSMIQISGFSSSSKMVDRKRLRPSKSEIKLYNLKPNRRYKKNLVYYKQFDFQI
jgi:RNase P subunit RPR2